MNELALFAGGGGGILGGKLLGWRTICAVEIASYARSILLARQRDGILESFPIWDDVTTFDGKQWRGRVDVISGGFPCQDISASGQRAGIDGERSGLWKHMSRIICEVGPRYVLVENSPMLTIRGLDRVLGDFTKMGYNADWGTIGAACVGKPHLRERIWIVAHHSTQRSTGILGRSFEIMRNMEKHIKAFASFDIILEEFRRIYATEENQREGGLPSYLWRVHDGMAGWLERIDCIGNGQVPEVAALAWNTLNPDSTKCDTVKR